MAIQTISKKQTTDKLLQTLIKEVRRLNHKIDALSLPREDWDEYDEPEEIKQAYQRAIKQYPPKI